MSKRAMPGLSGGDFNVPRFDRFKWPKVAPDLSRDQQTIVDDFMKYWHHELPRRYGAIERFNHTYPVQHIPPLARCRTLELGAGIGGHLAFEPLERQEYHCVELRASMADEIRRRYPQVVTVTADCQNRLPYEDAYFDRVIAIHVLEHLSNLPAALAEIERVLKPDGLFSIVIPCDPGLAYEIARKVSAERLFRRRYKVPYRWLIRREHLNSPAEILQVIGRRFSVFHTRYFPLVIPVANLNLCIGVSARRAPAGSH